MPLVATNDQHYSNIAGAIRAKNGQDTAYKPSEMADAILAIGQQDGLVMKHGTISDGAISTGLANIEFLVIIRKNTESISESIIRCAVKTPTSGQYYCGAYTSCTTTGASDNYISISGGEVTLKNSGVGYLFGISTSYQAAWWALGTE